jgi:hypothetical protein
MLRGDRAIEQCQLDAQCFMTTLWQGLDEVLYRRAYTSRDLNAARAVASIVRFTASKMPDLPR